MKTDTTPDRNERPAWEGHRERLRRREAQEGWDALKASEMVELVLYHAVPRQDISGISRALIERFGTVGGVFGASREQLATVEGVTPALAEWVALTGEMILAYREVCLFTGINLSRRHELIRFLKTRLCRDRREGQWVLYADYDRRLIACPELHKRAAWWEDVNMRTMMADAIGNGAKYLYVVQLNGEYRDVKPARLETITGTLRAADLELADCLYVRGRRVFSMYGRRDKDVDSQAPDSHKKWERIAEDKSTDDDPSED